ncbi:flagellar motor protein MotB [Hahella ganghwensis]|uniref:flagellar motor protein MotB n=1 Tax=Hahella ganghwensis TaxID=286420 RepID=UPI00035EA527|nr:flagellar motor protein MotB [Hahella ganghwensis]
MMEEQPPIIVRRVRKYHKGHGGAWKVAFADFATAMMAFFLVLWLSASTTKEQKEAVAGYFSDPVGFEEGGSPYVIDLEGSVTVTVTDDTAQTPETQPEVVMEEETIEDIATQVEQRRLEKLMDEILAEIDSSAKLKEFKDQLIIDITEEGLRIQIVDKRQRPMFDSGDSTLKPYFEDILYELAKLITRVRNKVSISGHTDGAPYLGRANYTNWELSSDRANAARRALVDGGLPENRLARVVGLASSVLYDDKDPLNPVNRRISIIVLNKKTQAEIEDAEQVDSDVSTNQLSGEVDKLIRQELSKPAFDPNKDLPIEQKPENGGQNGSEGLNW